jgi:hypothetical protein
MDRNRMENSWDLFRVASGRNGAGSQMKTWRQSPAGATTLRAKFTNDMALLRNIIAKR